MGGPAALTPIRVFLLEDHEIVRRGIEALLADEEDLLVVGVAGTVEEALRRIPAVRPDVAVLDSHLPDGSGAEVCRELASADSEVRCLILTAFDEDDALLAAVLAGAAGYLLKQTRGLRLAPAVRLVAAGGSLLDPGRTGRLLSRMRPEPQRDGRFGSLSYRERQVLARIADGMTNRQIGVDLALSEKTIKNYVSGLFVKLGMHSRTQAAVFGADHREVGPGRAVAPDSDGRAAG
jgi:DNA-binding NarL/FixJ family response regulator